MVAQSQHGISSTHTLRPSGLGSPGSGTQNQFSPVPGDTNSTDASMAVAVVSFMVGNLPMRVTIVKACRDSRGPARRYLAGPVVGSVRLNRAGPIIRVGGNPTVGSNRVPRLSDTDTRDKRVTRDDVSATDIDCTVDTGVGGDIACDPVDIGNRASGIADISVRGDIAGGGNLECCHAASLYRVANRCQTRTDPSRVARVRVDSGGLVCVSGNRAD